MFFSLMSLRGFTAVLGDTPCAGSNPEVGDKTPALGTPAASDADGVSIVTKNAEKGVLRHNSISERTEWAQAQAAADSTTTPPEAASSTAAADAIEKGSTAGMEAAALNDGCPMEELTPLQLESVNNIAELLESEVRAILSSG